MLLVQVELGKTGKYQTQITEKVQNQEEKHYVFNFAHGSSNACRRVGGIVGVSDHHVHPGSDMSRRLRCSTWTITVDWLTVIQLTLDHLILCYASAPVIGVPSPSTPLN